MQMLKKLRIALRRHPHRTLAGLFVLSVACIVLGLAGSRYVVIPSGYTRATGKVRDVNVVGSKENPKGYVVLIDFTDEKGKQYSLRGEMHNPANYAAGQTTMIAYFPGNPNAAIDVSDRPNRPLANMLQFIGVAGLVAIILWSGRIWWRAEDVPADAEDTLLDTIEAKIAVTKDSKRRQAVKK